MLTEEEREKRDMFMPIAVFEHHYLLEPIISTCDIAERLGDLWKEIKSEAKTRPFTLKAECILIINDRVAKSLNSVQGEFLKKEEWPDFVEECGDIEEDPSHVSSWMFSALYWSHLTKFKLSTAWMFINAIRVQHDLPEYRLTLENLGPFLDGLSGSGPPIYDGQTFYPENYSP